MKTRRLSIEPLEDRTTPATSADLWASARQTYATALLLRDLAKDSMSLANPAFRPAVQSYFTGIHQHAAYTQSLLAQMPGVLPPGVANAVSGWASIQKNIAAMVGSRLGFNLGSSIVPGVPVNPTPRSDAGLTNTMPSATDPAFVTQPSGLKIWDVRQGTGEAVSAGAKVSVFYTGWLAATGTQFDARRSPARPAKFDLDGLIQGWQLGVPGMKDGGIRRLYVPAALGYGAAGSPPNIPANADLIFEIKLVDHTNPSATPGAASPAASTVAAAPTSVSVGGTSTVTLTARDANGTALTTGGATVGFALGSGTGQGTFSSVTDNGNGTYAANFTGTTAGTNTITATLNGTAVTTTPPSITVVGPPNPAQSVVTVSPASIATGGTSTVTLTARDANGALVPTGGATVSFALEGGTADGTFGPVTDNGNGTYTATFTGTAEGTNTIGATLNAQPVTSNPPVITVTSASTAADPAESTIELASAAPRVGDSSTVTLVARDANGNALTTGGASVTFGQGTGTAQGTFTAVTDNGDGTYEATFTATATGTNTITGTINGQAVTSTLPTVTVTAPAADPGQSAVTLAPASIPTGGTNTVRLTARDANGNQLTTGGSMVVFSLGNGAADGTFGTVTDNGNGTYTAPFTGTTAGTNTVTATVDGTALTSPPPTITVTPASNGPDPAQSTVTIDLDTLAVGDTATVTLEAADANGDPVTVGGATVTFGLGSGTAQGTFSSVTDNGDGTYDATFTATVAGTNTITTKLNGQPVTTTPPSVTVTSGSGNAAPGESFVSIDNDMLAVGETATVLLIAADANGDPLTTGGSTVTFGLGTGTGKGKFGSVIDNGDGSYEATFTATGRGDNTITATIDGQAVTSDPPTVTIS